MPPAEHASTSLSWAIRLNTIVAANAPAKGSAKPSTVGAVKPTNRISADGGSSPSDSGRIAAAKLMTPTRTAQVREPTLRISRST